MVGLSPSAYVLSGFLFVFFFFFCFFAFGFYRLLLFSFFWHPNRRRSLQRLLRSFAMTYFMTLWTSNLFFIYISDYITNHHTYIHSLLLLNTCYSYLLYISL